MSIFYLSAILSAQILKFFLNSQKSMLIELLTTYATSKLLLKYKTQNTIVLKTQVEMKHNKVHINILLKTIVKCKLMQLLFSFTFLIHSLKKYMRIWRFLLEVVAESFFLTSTEFSIAMTFAFPIKKYEKYFIVFYK